MRSRECGISVEKFAILQRTCSGVNYRRFLDKDKVTAFPDSHLDCLTGIPSRTSCYASNLFPVGHREITSGLNGTDQRLIATVSE